MEKKPQKQTKAKKEADKKTKSPGKERPKYLRYAVITSVVVAAAGVSAYLFLSPPATSTLDGADTKKTAPFQFILGKGETPPAGQQKIETKINIKGVKFVPDKPTAADAIRAEINHDYTGDARLEFVYSWDINGVVVENVSGNELKSVPLKTNDIITVTVVPVLDGVRSDPYESVVVVHPSPSPLEMKLVSNGLNRGQPFFIQLSSRISSDDKPAYALEEPFLEGMTIDKESGKITWTPPAATGKGKHRFGASVMDKYGNKTSDVFEFDLSAEKK